MYLFMGFGLLMAAVSLFSLFFALTRRANMAHWLSTETTASAVAYLVTAFVGMASVLFAWSYSEPLTEQVAHTPTSLTAMLVIATVVGLVSLRAIRSSGKGPMTENPPHPIQPRSPQRPSGNGRKAYMSQAKKRAA